MRSIAFPNMFNGAMTNIVYGHDASMQNTKMLLGSEKGEMFGDPYFGSNLKKFLYNQKDLVLKDIIIDDIYTAIATFMPQLTITRKDITIDISDRGKVVAKIKVINKIDFTTDLYQIVLLQEAV